MRAGHWPCRNFYLSQCLTSPPASLGSHVSCQRAGSRFARGGPIERGQGGCPRKRSQCLNVSCLLGKSRVSCLMSARQFPYRQRRAHRAARKRAFLDKRHATFDRHCRHAPRDRRKSKSRDVAARVAYRVSRVPHQKLFPTFFSRPLARSPRFCYTCNRQRWAGPSQGARVIPIPLWIERKNE